MKTLLYVFSGTGNSLFVAKHLQRLIGEECELRSLDKHLKQNTEKLNAQAIGFIFPLYFGGLPDIVMRFISPLQISSDTYFFAVVTAGAGSAGNSLDELDKILNAKKSKLDDGFAIEMPSNYTPGWIYPLIRKTPVQHEAIFTHAQMQLETIASKIKNKDRAGFPRSAVMGNMPKIINARVLFEKLSTWDRDFSVNEKCNGCSLCENNCPVKNIKLEHGRPQWSHNCLMCLRCAGYCPQQAIDFKKISIRRPWYHHPDIKADEFHNL